MSNKPKPLQLIFDNPQGDSPITNKVPEHLSHMGFGYLDVDPAINAAQQLRVLELRTTDVSM